MNLWNMIKQTIKRLRCKHQFIDTKYEIGEVGKNEIQGFVERKCWKCSKKKEEKTEIVKFNNRVQKKKYIKEIKKKIMGRKVKNTWTDKEKLNMETKK